MGSSHQKGPTWGQSTNHRQPARPNLQPLLGRQQQQPPPQNELSLTRVSLESVRKNVDCWSVRQRKQEIPLLLKLQRRKLVGYCSQKVWLRVIRVLDWPNHPSVELLWKCSPGRFMADWRTQAGIRHKTTLWIRNHVTEDHKVQLSKCQWVRPLPHKARDKDTQVPKGNHWLNIQSDSVPRSVWRRFWEQRRHGDSKTGRSGKVSWK